MNKKYQVFISSTYNDLIEERSEIAKSILDLGHIPAGMESFLSADEDQFSYIKKIIDQCDYYILIIAGRYGSESEDEFSYTEKEFDYAVSSGKTILVLIHSDAMSLPAKFVENEHDKTEKLQKFRDKVKSGRLASFWTSKDDLKAKVIISLSKAISATPGVGWMRGSAAASEEILAEINRLRIENDKLKQDSANLDKQLKPLVRDIASMDEDYVLHYNYSFRTNYDTEQRVRSLSLSWNELFSVIVPKILSPSTEARIHIDLMHYLKETKGIKTISSIFSRDLSTIKIHLCALQLIMIESAEAKGGGLAEFISTTALGRAKLTEIMAVRKISPSKDA
jgi:hypothetical protein